MRLTGIRAAHLIATAALLAGDLTELAAQLSRPAEAWDSPERRLLFLAELAKDDGDTQALASHIESLKSLKQARRDLPGPALIRSLDASISLLEGNIDPALSWLERSITDTVHGIWCMADVRINDDQPRGINLDRLRYPELYSHPEFSDVTRKYHIDAESIRKIEVPDPPF